MPKMIMILEERGQINIPKHIANAVKANLEKTKEKHMQI